jgi:hypothetical protein
MTNINMEVVSTAPIYTTGEGRETPHARACHASPEMDPGRELKVPNYAV